MRIEYALVLHQAVLSYVFPLSNYYERVMRIELTSPAWEAGVIAIIRHPLTRFTSLESYENVEI